jgi:rubrerythrin
MGNLKHFSGSLFDPKQNMSDSKNDHNLAQAFALLSRAAKRKKIYAHKAARIGRPEVAHFLRAMAASEGAQARRLFNSLIGKIDTSDEYLTTLFEQEVRAILEHYANTITDAAERPALLHIISQLRAAEIRLRGFYSMESRDVDVDKDARYFVCQFCGYLSTGSPPEKCPICSAPRDAFQEIA